MSTLNSELTETTVPRSFGFSMRYTLAVLVDRAGLIAVVNVEVICAVLSALRMIVCV